MILVIPTRNGADIDRTRYDQFVLLAGRTWLFTLDCSTRDDTWRLSIADDAGSVVLTGAPLLLGVDVLAGLGAALPGKLALIPNTASVTTECGLRTLGVQAQLMWASPDEFLPPELLW